MATANLINTAATDRSHLLRAAIALRDEVDAGYGRIARTADYVFSLFGTFPRSYSDQRGIERALNDVGVHVEASARDGGRTLELFLAGLEASAAERWLAPSAVEVTTDHVAVAAMGGPVAAEQTRYAGWWARVGATLLDGLILFAFGFALALLAWALTGSFPAAYGSCFVMGLLYAPLLMARDGAHNGQTWGKQATGIRVIRDDGSPMSFGRGLLREAVGKTLLGLLTLYIYSLLDYLWPLWDGKKQALHDKVASTHIRAD